VAKAVYNHPHTRATMEALRAAPVFRRLCGLAVIALFADHLLKLIN